MRRPAKSILAAIAALMLAPAAPHAQVTPAAPTATPKAPIPYSALRPKPVAKPAALSPTPTTPAAATGSAAPSPGLAPAAPAVVAASGARLSVGESLPQAELEAFVDGVVRDAMDREHIAGVTVAVVQNGQIVLKKGYGAASLSPARRVNPDTTLFRIGSISKTFTWIALMREVEAGRIRIDGPVNLYLPESLQVRDQGYRAPVRIANLMDHSAGFEDRALGQLIERTPARERTLATYIEQQWQRRVRAPGQVSSYSNYGAALAGEAVSYVTGKPYEQLIEDEILRPLALNHTTFREARPPAPGLPAPMSRALAQDLSDGFRWTPAGFQARPYEYLGHIAPAGSASSTAADMARYMSALLNDGALDGSTIFGPRAARAFRTEMRDTPDGVNGWAHGFIRYELPGGYAGYGHDGGTLSFVSRMVVSPQLKLGVFISTNTETGGELVRRLPDRIVRQFYLPPQVFPRPGSPALAAKAQRFEGYYVGARRAYGGLEGFIGLMRNGVTVKVTPEGRLLTISAEGARIWTPEGDLSRGVFISATGDEHLAFTGSGARADTLTGALGEQAFQRSGRWKSARTLLTFTALAAVCALGTLGGIFLRNRREFRETSLQSLAGMIQNLQAVLWLTAFALAAGWMSKTGDVANVMYGWPGVSMWLVAACLVVASFLTVVTAGLLPFVLRGGRRLDSWSGLRKAGYVYTVGVYGVLSLLLLLTGALAIWRW